MSKTVIHVNGRKVETSQLLFYDEIVRLADKDVNGPALTVTYNSPKGQGALVRGDLIFFPDGMTFNVTEST